MCCLQVMTSPERPREETRVEGDVGDGGSWVGLAF